jgi:hypothetical protein
MGLDPGNAVPQRFDVPWLTLSCVFTVLACTTAARAQEVVPPALPVCPPGSSVTVPCCSMIRSLRYRILLRLESFPWIHS